MSRAYLEYSKHAGGAHGAAIMWKHETIWQLMTCCVTLHNMIVEDEGDGVARTDDFEKPRVQVLLEEQEVRCNDNSKVNKCICNFSIISWSICGCTYETIIFRLLCLNCLMFLCIICTSICYSYADAR